MQNCTNCCRHRLLCRSTVMPVATSIRVLTRSHAKYSWLRATPPPTTLLSPAIISIMAGMELHRHHLSSLRLASRFRSGTRIMAILLWCSNYGVALVVCLARYASIVRRYLSSPTARVVLKGKATLATALVWMTFTTASRQRLHRLQHRSQRRMDGISRELLDVLQHRQTQNRISGSVNT